MKSEQRDVGIDLIKSLALIFVFALHFILHNDMYSVNVNNWGMYLMVLVRTLCMTCVPLFLMATGYLMNQKIFSKKYYMKIDRILIMYVIISLVIWLFRVYYMQEVIPLKVGISEMLGYSSAGYQWYVEMYIGLYLLIPFLNKFWHSLEQKEKKQIIGVISLLVTVPTIFACIKDIKILPEWWKNIWPLLFYFLGAYMQEYKINITKIKWIFINSIVLCVSTLFTIIKSGNGTIYTGASTNNWGGQTVLLSITIFGFISNSKINVAVPVKKILVRISNMTLPMYLGSYIADQVIYNVLLKSNEVVSNWYIYFLPAIVGVFAISFLIALLVLEVYKVYNVIKKNSMLYLSK